MKKALVLAGGLPQIELIEELKSRGYETVLADYTEHPLAEKAADRFYRESTLDLDAIRKIAVSEQVDRIVTCCTDQALATVAILSQELHLPCYIDAKTGQAVTNKRYMKAVFAQNGIPTARFAVVNDPGEHPDIPFPAVVKPVDCNSSRGVCKVFDRAQMEKAVAKAISCSRTGTAIVEEYLEGTEVSVDLFVTDGKAKILCVSTSEKVRSRQGFLIYKGIYPARISDTASARIAQMAQRIVQAFGLKNSPMLLQTLVCGDEVYAVEFSARTGGCVKHRMIELASGIPVIRATVDLFEGKPVRLTPKRDRGCIVDEFVYCREGVFDHIEGVEFCMAHRLVREIHVLKTPGTRMTGAETSGDRIAALIYAADTYEAYVDCHNQAVRALKVIDTGGADMMRHDLLPVL